MTSNEMGLQIPLSETELDELEDFIDSDNAPEYCLNISALDGFLTALVCGPEVIMPSKWLPKVWGDEEGAQFESPEQASRIMELLFRHMNSINTALKAGEGFFRPLLHLAEEDGKACITATEWCYGFMIYIEWRYKAWVLFLENEEVSISLVPIMALASDEKQEDFQELVNTPEKRDDLADLIPLCVEDIYRFWEEARQARPNGVINDSFFLPSKKPGRNEPCPCGSGKKFKKCCGAPLKLH